MKVTHSAKFGRIIKKLHSQEKTALDKAIKRICDDPQIGRAKKGDLAGLYTYKFKVKDQEWILAYLMVSDFEIRLVLLGPHENYYRVLKRLL